jgi:hypothetical protein
MQFSAKATLASLAVAGAGTFFQPTAAHATPILQIRCSTDSLDPATAKLRLEWARACGDKVNLVSPTSPIAPAITYLTGTNDVNGVPLHEYIETDDFWGKNSFSGDVEAVNQIFTQNQWHVGAYTASTAAGGFQKWTEPDTLALPRPTYPTFGNNADINVAVQIFPNQNYSLVDCNMYTTPAATTVVNTSVTGFFVNGFCTSSCYTPDQQVMFADGPQAIVDATNNLTPNMRTLTPSSTLENLQFHTDAVESFTREIHDSTHVIFDIRTASGGELKVTDKHPVVVGSGRIVEARSLKAGDQLIKADGTRDRITSVEKTTHFGKVYNLKPVATNHVANILIAQGFLVGSSRFQNEDVDFMNRIILGRSIPGHVIPQ